MDYLFQLLLVIHLLALVVGTATTVAMPVVMSRMAGAGPEARPSFMSIGKRLSLNARVAVGVLVLSGLAMVLVRYGGFEAMSGWFWFKMVLVTVIIVAMVLGLVARPGALNPRVMSVITRGAIIGIIVASVLAFH